MDYGTIVKKLENGEYSPPPDTPNAGMDAMEETLLMVLKDIKQVHHNCFLYNYKGSSFYRAGQVQERKWNAYFNEIKAHLPYSIAESLEMFQKSCEAESDTWQKTRSVHFQVSTPAIRGKAYAVFDPDAKRIVKQYSSKSSAKRAAIILHDNGYACEYELTESNVKTHVENAEDPSKPLFGYQWVPTEKLKSGTFQVKELFHCDALAM